MRFRVMLVFLFSSASLVPALEGHWVLTSSIAQTVVNDEVFYADDTQTPLISEINFRTDQMAEVLLQTSADEKPSWHGAGYSREGEYLFMEIVGFGKVRIFWQKKLKDKLLLSYLVYITEDGIKQPEPADMTESGDQADAAAEESETAQEGAVEISGLLQAVQPDLLMLPEDSGIFSESPGESMKITEENETAAPGPQRQLLIISSYFKPE